MKTGFNVSTFSKSEWRIIIFKEINVFNTQYLYLLNKRQNNLLENIVSQNKALQTIKKILNGGYPQFGKIKLRKDEILELYPSIRKAKEIINWKPKISFEKGLKTTIKYYNE